MTSCNLWAGLDSPALISWIYEPEKFTKRLFQCRSDDRPHAELTGREQNTATGHPAPTERSAQPQPQDGEPSCPSHNTSARVPRAGLGTTTCSIASAFPHNNMEQEATAKAQHQDGCNRAQRGESREQGGAVGRTTGARIRSAFHRQLGFQLSKLCAALSSGNLPTARVMLWLRWLSPSISTSLQGGWNEAEHGRDTRGEGTGLPALHGDIRHSGLHQPVLEVGTCCCRRAKNSLCNSPWPQTVPCIL